MGHISVSSIWQPPFVCFGVLGRAALTLSWCTCYIVRGGAFCNHQGGATLHHLVVLYGGEGLERDQFCLLGSHIISSYFLNFPFATGALLAAALVLNPIVGGFVHILGLNQSFKQALLRDWQFLPPPNLPWLLQPEFEILFAGTGTQGCAVCPGIRLFTSQVSLPIFIHHT